MIYQLKNGKIIDIPVEKFLEMTDDELQELESKIIYGVEMNDPWFDSVLLDGIEKDDAIEDDIKEIDRIDINEKFKDLDIEE